MLLDKSNIVDLSDSDSDDVEKNPVTSMPEIVDISDSDTDDTEKTPVNGVSEIVDLLDFETNDMEKTPLANVSTTEIVDLTTDLQRASVSRSVQPSSEPIPESRRQSCGTVEKCREIAREMSRALPGHSINPNKYSSHLSEVRGCRLRNGDSVRAWSAVELPFESGGTQEYLLVHHIFRDTRAGESKIILRGLKLHNNEKLEGFIPYGESGATEVHIVANVCAANKKYPLIQALIDINAEDVIKVRPCILTNQAYPALEYQSEDIVVGTPLGKDILVCRWQYIRTFKDYESKCRGRIQDLCVTRLKDKHCTSRYALNDYQVWQNAKKGSSPQKRSKNGAWTSSLSSALTCLTSTSSMQASQPKIYKCAEGFCACGGATAAFKDAGFTLGWCFDLCENACNTHRKNFPEANCEMIDCKDFGKTAGRDYTCDHVHLSPPCQWCSRANRQRDNLPEDDPNRACFLEVPRLIALSKCRTFSLEETDGILDTRQFPYFRKVVGEITTMGFSVRWKIVPLDEHGNVHRRKRLTLFGAGPGEILPSFPPRTHGPIDDGLKPLVTIRDALAEVNTDSELHNVREVMFKRFQRKAPYDSNKPLSHCIMTKPNKDKDDYHPTGQRSFTLAELAIFQGFHNTHQFEGTYDQIRTGIGNAVPGKAFIPFARSCLEALKETDRRYSGNCKAAVERGTQHAPTVISERPLAQKASVISSLSLKSPGKRPREGTSNDGPVALKRPKRRHRMRTMQPTRKFSEPRSLSDIPDVNTRAKIRQILEDFPDKQVLDCWRALQKANGNADGAITALVIADAEKATRAL
ncbi:MAG: hypothetical protein M1820_002193 [Bogoriella megaspora]|nr:MAG: hypothetical protein M1820_002193 [Bogoriella megaspora]